MNAKLWALVGSLSLLAVVGIACAAAPVTHSAGSPRPTSTVGGDACSEWNVAEHFPLALGNTWVYSGTFYQGFDRNTVLTATYVVTETVVDILRAEQRPHMIYQVARYKSVRSCPEPWVRQGQGWCSTFDTPEPEYFWYIIDGNTMYQQRKLEVFRLPARSVVELVFPLEMGRQWYLSAELQEQYPDYKLDAMLRKVERKGSVDSLAGDFDECFLMTDVVGGNASRTWYCAGVGIVEQATDHSGTPFGSRELLAAYSFP